MRAHGIQVLTDDILALRPGVTIYGIGDDAHKLQISGHNEDDTPGVRAEDQDPDNTPEHRAIDVMRGSNWSHEDALALYTDLSTIPQNQRRLLYVIYNGKIRSASRNWEERDFDGEPHTDHDHVSGEADADEVLDHWLLPSLGGAVAPMPQPGSEDLKVDGQLGPKTISRWQQIMGTPVDGYITPGNSMLVRAVQQRLNDTVNLHLIVDGDGIYQNNKRYKTVGALQTYLKSPVDQILSYPVSQCVKALQRRLNEGKF